MSMKKLVFFIFSLIYLSSFAQEDAWVFLADKPNAATFLANPLTMLSQRSLGRRTKQNIALDNKDVPLHTAYYNQVVNATGITVLAKSKWLNAIHVQGTEADIKALKTDFTFVASIEFADRSLNTGGKTSDVKPRESHQNKFEETLTDFDYGSASNQITMLHGDFLHQQGFTGNGMQIAILDAGFPNVDTNPAFQRLRDNNQIIGGYNFVNRNTNFYSRNSHGAHVLSNIGGYLENEYVGTAPDAKFYLFITEDNSQEAPIEESLWVEAAERADSLGVDVINTSLGYTTFDKASYNHTYADMNGSTTFITRGAEIGASRGMILVNSAGNSGSSAWHYVGAPADAISVLSVGAVNSSSVLASFSSRGPTADNRIKPDVMAQGAGAAIVNYSSGNVSSANGTSFSSPILTGVIACFWQAYPTKTAEEIKTIIKESSDRFNNPDNDYGYGIPNFETAFNTLRLESFTSDELYVNIYPNPVKDVINLSIVGAFSDYSITIYSILGKKVYQENELLSSKINISKLHRGIYLLKIQRGNLQRTIKMIKK